MKTLLDIVVLLHMLCWAVVLGGNVATMRTKKAYVASLHAALGALVTGLIIVGLVYAGAVDWRPNNLKIGIKTVIALVVCFLSWQATRNKNNKLAAPIAALTAVNVAIAVLW